MSQLVSQASPELWSKAAWIPARCNFRAVEALSTADLQRLVHLLLDEREDDICRHRLAVAAHVLMWLPRERVEGLSKLCNQVATNVVQHWWRGLADPLHWLHSFEVPDAHIRHLTSCLAGVAARGWLVDGESLRWPAPSAGSLPGARLVSKLRRSPHQPLLATIQLLLEGVLDVLRRTSPRNPLNMKWGLDGMGRYTPRAVLRRACVLLYVLGESAGEAKSARSLLVEVATGYADAGLDHDCIVVLHRCWPELSVPSQLEHAGKQLALRRSLMSGGMDGGCTQGSHTATMKRALALIAPSMSREQAHELWRLAAEQTLTGPRVPDRLLAVAPKCSVPVRELLTEVLWILRGSLAASSAKALARQFGSTLQHHESASARLVVRIAAESGRPEIVSEMIAAICQAQLEAGSKPEALPLAEWVKELRTRLPPTELPSDAEVSSMLRPLVLTPSGKHCAANEVSMSEVTSRTLQHLHALGVRVFVREGVLGWSWTDDLVTSNPRIRQV